MSTLRTILATALLAVQATNLEDVAAPATEHHSSKHPIVQARANSVELTSRNNVDYFGSIYAGSKQKELSVSFDTMSEWTVILNSGHNNYSPYDAVQSKTAKEIYHDEEQTVVQKQNVDLGQIQFNGEEYTDDICLLQSSKGERTVKTGRLCAQNLRLVVANEVIADDNFEGIQGVIGLAPSLKPNNFLTNLYSYGWMADKVVGLNFENIADSDQRSVINWGEINYGEVVGGEDGLSYHQNLGLGFWGMPINAIEYGNTPVTTGKGISLGLIDSGNSSIQLGGAVFQKVYEAMKEDEPTVFIDKRQDRVVLSSRNPCHTLDDDLQQLKFIIGDTWLEIKPEGYVFQEGGEDTSCFLGIERIDDSAHHIRLGTVFLRNFYVGLDYIENEIMIGVNAGSSDRAKATILGKNPNPNSSGLSTGVIVLVLVVLFALAIVFYFKSQKEDDTKKNPQKKKLLGEEKLKVPKSTLAKQEEEKKKVHTAIQNESFQEEETLDEEEKE